MKTTGHQWLLRHVLHDGDACLRWPWALHANGYGQVTVANKNRLAHRVMLEFATGGECVGMHAAHSCNNRWCVNPRHLRWATPTENQIDRFAHGTSDRGERNSQAKLTEADVLKVSELLDARQLSLQQIADQFAITKQNVWMIQHGKAWGWLTGRTRGGDQNRAA
jgi:hypothetical protein